MPGFRRVPLEFRKELTGWNLQKAWINSKSQFDQADRTPGFLKSDLDWGYLESPVAFSSFSGGDQLQKDKE